MAKTIESLREELEVYTQGLVVMDDISRKEQEQVLEDFDEWAKKATIGDSYYYDNEVYTITAKSEEEDLDTPGTEVKFTVACNVIYHGSLIIPESVPKTKADYLNYIRENLCSVNVEDLEWLEDLSPKDAVTEEDVRDWGDLDEKEEDEDIEL